MQRLIIALLFGSVMFSLTAEANPIVQSLFGGVELVGRPGSYLVTKDRVNVRDKPAADGKKLLQLSQMEEVFVRGKVKGSSWFAIERSNVELGFVFETSLTPLTRASLQAPLEGKLERLIHAECAFRLNDEGRTVEEETVFVSVDYFVELDCRIDNHSFSMNAMMFMSEVPPDLGLDPVYQITFNLPEVAIGYEDFLSMTVLYDIAKNKVVFDDISLKDLQAKVLRTEEKAHTLREALHAALSLQLGALNEKGWKTVAGIIPEPAAQNQPD